ncbi:synaptotagmin-15, partial [Elysia marginata]
SHRTTSEEDDLSSSDSPNGRLWYSLLYNPELEELAVTLIKVKDLPGRAPGNNPRDPFVKMYVLPDERTVRVSTVKRKTLNPVYNETLLFVVSRSDVTKRILRFSVYDLDKRRVRHSLGHVMVNLKDADLTTGDTRSADLETSAQPVSGMGDVQVSLLYQPHNDKIKVGLHRARNLSRLSDFPKNIMGAYIRIQLFYGHKCHRVKRTLAVVPGSDITFNESLSFTVQGRQFDSCNIAISLMLTFPGSSASAVKQASTTGSSRPSGTGGGGGVPTTGDNSDREYGRVVLGPFMYARGEELAHWQEMLGHPKAVSTKWHALTNSSSSGHSQAVGSP